MFVNFKRGQQDACEFLVEFAAQVDAELVAAGEPPVLAVSTRAI